MTSIGSINGVFASGSICSGNVSARDAAAGIVGEIGSRVLAWVGAIGGGEDRAGWSAAIGATSDFRPDAHELARGGDIYGLREIGDELATRFGATPAQEGSIRRSLEGFTRETVIQMAGLSGGDRQIAGVRGALATATDATAPEGIEGVIQRLDAATAMLAQQNGR